MECASSLSAQASIAGGRISALELLSKEKSHAAFPDEALDADDAKTLHGSSEYEEQLVEDFEADATDSETEIFPQIDAVVTSDQELDAVLEDGADVALPDENLDVDNAKIVYDSRENEEQLVEHLEAEATDSEAGHLMRKRTVRFSGIVESQSAVPLSPTEPIRGIVGSHLQPFCGNCYLMIDGPYSRCEICFETCMYYDICLRCFPLRSNFHDCRGSWTPQCF